MINPVLAFAFSVILAGLLDAILGDPVFPFHPVRLIGSFAMLMEKSTCRIFKPRFAGLASWLAVLLVVSLLSIALSWLAWRWNFIAGILMDSVLIWAAIAPRDLASHALRVFKPLSQGDLVGARSALSMIVGRHTAILDEAGVVRATVEGVAESTVDGVLAPLFWAALLGPSAALAYRAINTMDSLFGHKNQRYFHFGFVPAKADDLANLLPARLCIIPILGATIILRLDTKGAVRIFRRDRLKHESPNAGHPESVFAGALGIRLGGPSDYAEGRIDKPWLGESVSIASARHILQSVWLMLLASVSGIALAIGVHAGVYGIFRSIFQ